MPILISSNGFLNDSFCESPLNKDTENNQNIGNKKTESIFNANNKLPIIVENGESSGPDSGKRDSTSRQLKFDETDEKIITKKEPDRPKISLFSKIQSNENTKKLRETVTVRNTEAAAKIKPIETKSADSLNTSLESLALTRPSSAPIKSTDTAPTDQLLCTDLQTPKVKSNDADRSNVPQKVDAIDDETPYKTFQVPQTSTMRRVQSSSQQRSILSSANQPRKCRTELEKEFRSQKVLFTTPSAVSRPAIKVMNHLGLDDSLNCYKSSPMTNLAPVKEESQPNNKENKYSTNESNSKMNDLYRSVDKIDEEVNTIDKDQVKETANENEEKKEQKIIIINGKEFIIHKKIGQGGSSSVFLVEHKETKRECALKVESVLFKSIYFNLNVCYFFYLTRWSIYVAIQH